MPGKSHGQRSLVGCSPQGRKELDTTEQLHFLFSLSCTGEGNGNPLQCSCLENPRDKGAWWAAVYGIAQSQTRLKGLSNSSSSSRMRKQDQICNVLLPNAILIKKRHSLDSNEEHGLAGRQTCKQHKVPPSVHTKNILSIK